MPDVGPSLAARIYRACYLEGDFTLRSGRSSKFYFDKYQFEADPILLDDIATRMLQLIPADTEVLAGLEVGGIPVVTALSRVSGLPAAFIRKESKGYGTARFAEGAAVAGRRITVVEDVVTSGGQIVLSTQDIRGIEGIVDHALCVVDRQQGGQEKLAEVGLQLRALFTAAELVAAVA